MKRSILNLSILDSLLEGFQVIDYNWRYLYVNTTVATQGQSSAEKLIGRTMMECYPGIEKTEMFARLKECMEKRTVHQFENEFVYNDGGTNWFELRVEPIPEGIFILSTNITNRKKAEAELLQLKDNLEKKVKQRTAELEKLNNEKDVILKEMHHRVKNNLQIISSLIRLQMEEDDHSSSILDKTQSRIETIASIHESLYKQKELSLISVADYWKKLFNDCLSTLVREPSNFRLNLNIAKNFQFPVDKMIPLGLLINELITNSILHGFKGRNVGEIDLSLEEKDGKFLMDYKDNGSGFETNGVPHNTEQHFGHFLIEGFSDQLNGRFKKLKSEKGVHFELEFVLD